MLQTPTKPVTDNNRKGSVFAHKRLIKQNHIDIPRPLKLNARLKMDGRRLLKSLPDEHIIAMFFDPQYRGVLDKLAYGNEGKNREKRRASLTPMSDDLIQEFIAMMSTKLIPSGHLFLWIDKFHLLSGFADWFENTNLQIVDMITWDKSSMGMGYRSRRVSEYCIIIQKRPLRAKGCWKVHNIRDNWSEKVDKKHHPHAKPIDLQAALIEAVSNEGDIILDPAAGDFSVMRAAHKAGRQFLGCDLEG